MGSVRCSSCGTPNSEFNQRCTACGSELPSVSDAPATPSRPRWGGAPEDRTIVGRELAHFRVLREIGAGGMGRVYAAEDTKLGRVVALKVLPPPRAADPEWLKRFQREARAVASLNHPNIVTIHSVEEARGLHFLSMELVEGQTLDHLIPEGGVTLETFFELALPIVEALNAAHRRRILHRDLKPVNIMRSVDGLVKVLDFGLAKLEKDPAVARAVSIVSDAVTPASSTGGDPLLDTAQSGTSMTTSGRVLGTIPYMSPEQLRGWRIDQRSDLFSLGIVFYEMATGQRPFRGHTAAEVMSAILRDDPLSPHKLRPDLPAELGGFIDRLLAKDPEKRFQSALEVHKELRSLARTLQGIELPAAPGRRRPLWIPAMAAAMVIVSALGLLSARMGLVQTAPLAWLAGAEPRLPEGRSTLTTLVSWPSVEFEGKISPDGKWLSFVSDRSGTHGLWLRRLSGGEPQQITDEKGTVWSHAWSPDSHQIAFLVRQDQEVRLKLIPAMGGSATRSILLKNRRESNRFLRWIGSGIYIEDAGEALLRFDLDDGTTRNVISARADIGLMTDFDVSEDERKVAFSVTLGARETIWISDLDGGHRKRLSQDEYSETRPHWLGSGSTELVFASNRSGQVDLWRMDLADGSPIPLTISSSIEEVDDTSRDGSMLTFRETQDRANLWLLDPETGKSHRLTGETLQDGWPSATADGRLVAFQRGKPTMKHLATVLDGQIWLGQLTATGLQGSRKILDEGSLPALSPDGRWLSYVKPAATKAYEAWLLDVESGRSWRTAEDFRVAALILSSPVDWQRIQQAWSPDGDLFLVAYSTSGAEEIRRIRPGRDAGPEVEVVASGGGAASLQDLHLSNDGQWLSYVRTAKSRDMAELHIHDLGAGSDRVLLAEPLGRGNSLYSRGWIDDRSIVVLRSSLNEDWTLQLDVSSIDLAGGRHPAGRIENAFAGTARLEPRSRSLVLTKMAEDSRAHDLYSFSIDGGVLRSLTDTKVPGVSYAGLDVLPDGRVLYAQQERSENLSLITLER